jgi:CRP-like cAMP-binding protein
LLNAAIDQASLWRGEKSLKRGEFLKTGGTIDRKIYLISEGALRAFLLTPEEEQTIRFGYSRDILVALDSYISGEASDLYIQALKATQLRWIEREDLLNILVTDPKLMRQWHILLEGLVLQQMERKETC